MSADGSVVMIESGSCGGVGCFNGGSGSQFYRWTQASGIVPLGYGGGWVPACPLMARLLWVISQVPGHFAGLRPQGVSIWET